MIITKEMQERVLNRIKNMTLEEFEEIHERVKNYEKIDVIHDTSTLAKEINHQGISNF